MLLTSLVTFLLSCTYSTPGYPSQSLPHYNASTSDVRVDNYSSRTFYVTGYDVDYIDDSTFTFTFTTDSVGNYFAFSIKPVGNSQDPSLQNAVYHTLNFDYSSDYNLAVRIRFNYLLTDISTSTYQNIYTPTFLLCGTSTIQPYYFYFHANNENWSSQGNDILNIEVYTSLLTESQYNALATGNNYTTGYENGYNTGYENGLTDGNATGYQDGYDSGYSTGTTTGYNQGYSDALSTHSFTFMNLFSSIADTPILMIRRMFGFELFGTSLIAVFMSLFTALIIIKIIKKVF